VLERELDGIASAHIEELSEALAGFAEAMACGRADEKPYPQMTQRERRWGVAIPVSQCDNLVSQRDTPRGRFHFRGVGSTVISHGQVASEESRGLTLFPELPLRVGNEKKRPAT
jgi:hypothetical protein